MFTKLKIYAVAGAAFVLSLLHIYWRGKSAEADAGERERLEGYVETRKRMDDINAGDDPDVLRDWLRDRGER